MNDPAIRQDATFATTRWTVVLRARDSSSPEARAALEHLCGVYWYPLYAYVRGKGKTVDDAQDLTQGFFAQLLEKNYLNVVDRKRGKFRWFLLTAFKCYLANQHDRTRAEKRGGGTTPLSLDVERAEQRFRTEPATQAPSEAVFDRRWALTLLDRTRNQLAAEFAAQGHSERFDLLKDHLPGAGTPRPHADTAALAGMSEGAVKVEVHRLKKRFGNLLRAEIAQTVASPDEIDEEIRYLISVLAA